jgi:hypothetical protein
MDALQPPENRNAESDQSASTKGIREVPRSDTEEGKFIEAEDLTDRRDPEEARHNEAGTPMVTQGDFEMAKYEQIKSERR